MFDVMLISHGPLSQAMLESAQLICGEQSHVKAFGLYSDDSVDTFADTIKTEIRESLSNGELIVMTDIQSGSPFNVTCQAMLEMDFIHITGMNLPSVIQVLCDRDASAEQACQNCFEFCGDSIVNVNELLGDVLQQHRNESAG